MTKARRDAFVEDRLACEHEKYASRQEKLLDATRNILAQKDLDGLLQTAANAARELTGAKYATAGHGYINGVFTAGGISRSDEAMSCPHGKAFNVERGGVYLDLIKEKDSIRFTDAEMRSHPAWWGLPEDHVPLRGLVGARLVDVNGQPNGMIMASNKEDGGDFTAEDENVLSQVAAIISLALQHIEARLEAERKSSELEATISSIADGVITYGPNGEITSINAAAQELLGASRDNSSKMTIPERMRLMKVRTAKGAEQEPDQSPTVRALKGETVKGEVRVIENPITGSIIWTDNSAAPVYTADGRLLGAVATFTDITDRKQAEESLRESEEKFRAIADTSQAAITLYQDSRVVYANNASMTIFGYSLDERCSMKFWEMIHPDYRKLAKERMKALLEEGASRSHNEYKIIRKDGEERWVLSSGSPITYHGKPALMVTSIDITEHKLMEIKLQESEEKFRLVADFTYDWETWLDPKGNYNYVSPSCERITGYNAEEFIKNPQLAIDLVHPDDRDNFKDHRNIHFKGQTSIGQIDYRIITKNGDVRWINHLCQPVFGRNGEWLGRRANNRDITERKQVEEALRKSEERFRVAQELSLDAFTILKALRDDNGVIVDFCWEYINPTAGRILRHKPEELIGRRLLDVMPGNKDNSDLFNRYVRVVETGEPHDYELHYESEGIRGWFRNMTVKLGDGIAVYFTDITERKQAEKELIWLASFPRLNPSPVVEADLKGCVYFQNPAAQRLLPGLQEMGYDHPWLSDWESAVQKLRKSETNTYVRDVSIGDNWYQQSMYLLPDTECIRIYSMDITERKAAEEERQRLARELADSIAELRAVLNAAPVAVWIAYDPQCHKIIGNDYADQILQAPHGGNVSRSALPEDAAITYRVFRNGIELQPEEMPAQVATATGMPVMGEELELVFPNGRTVYLMESAVPLFGSEGHVRGAIITGSDVTQLKLAEKKLQESKEHLAVELADTKLLQSISAELVQQDRVEDLYEKIVDAAVAIMRSDYASLQMLYPERGSGGELRLLAFRGFTPEATKFWEWVGADSESTCGVALRTCRRVIAPDVENCEFMAGSEDQAMYRQTGIRAVQTTPLFSRTGKLVGMISTHWQEPHEPSERDWRLWDILARQAADLIEHKQSEEELRKSRDELEFRVQERTDELSQVNKRLEAVNITLIDEIKGHKDARAKLQQEIEEHKQTEEKLLRAKEAAEAATRAKAEFLANMSHEIRTPMNSVIGFTELLLDDSDDPLGPEQKEDLEAIRINGQALLTIINDILDFSKMESDKVVLEDQPFNLRECVEESLDLVSIVASEKGLNLSYAIDKGVPETIIGDPGRLRQVLGNLLSNAVKFTDEGEVTVSASSQQIDGANEVHFAVQDTGIGIPQDSMNQLFQPFNQMEPSTSRLYGGTGLGLAISKKLVELMDGRIWAESIEGIGSTFHFTIKASSSQLETQPAAISPQLIGKSALIVEDNKTNRRILSKQVYEWGMVPMAAKSGQEALNWIRIGYDFDIAILDIDLPDMDGLELEEKIRKHNKALPLVLLTSLGHGVPPNHAYLTKPIKASQLHRVLTEILPRTDVLPKEPAKSLAMASGVDQPIQNKPLRILLAEDNISSQKVVLQMLKKLGYKADVVANGIEVLQSLERQHYDVVLMDLRMPEMDGMEVTRIIRQRWLDDGPKIIAITAYALEGDRERCLGAGMDDYISKPVQKEDLARALGNISPRYAGTKVGKKI